VQHLKNDCHAIEENDPMAPLPLNWPPEDRSNYIWSNGSSESGWEAAFPSTPAAHNVLVKEERRDSMECLVQGGNRRQVSMEPSSSTLKRESMDPTTSSSMQTAADNETSTPPRRSRAVKGNGRRVDSMHYLGNLPFRNFPSIDTSCHVAVQTPANHAPAPVNNQSISERKRKMEIWSISSDIEESGIEDIVEQAFQQIMPNQGVSATL
jgi:hypothetical protein